MTTREQLALSISNVKWTCDSPPLKLFDATDLLSRTSDVHTYNKPCNGLNFLLILGFILKPAQYLNTNNISSFQHI